jgi:enoyl-CoA hydratase
MSNITVENYDDGVTLLTIDRPEKRNAICSKTAIELQNAFAEFDASEQRVAVLTGRGDVAFTAGADVNDVPELWRCIPTAGVATEKPVIGAVGGWCVGGGVVLAAMCDLLVVAENAKFSYPEAKLGLTHGMIATLAGRVPHKVAMEIILLGTTLEAKRAYDVGFVNRVVPTGQQVQAALEMARELAVMAPLVLKTLKRFVVDSVLPLSPSEQFARSKRQLEIVANSEDFQEGLKAYQEKRRPVFKGQ